MLATPAGLNASWFSAAKFGVDVEAALSRLPPLERVAGVHREKSGTLVLARAADAQDSAGVPAIVRMSYGRGQVVGILGEGLWRWGLLPTELEDLRGVYDTFWSNLVRWLALGSDFAPGEAVALQLSRTSTRLGDELTIDVVYRQTSSSGAAPRLEIRDPAGVVREVVLHQLPGQAPRFRTVVRPESTGVHVVTLLTPGLVPARREKRVNVYEVNLERLQTSANHAALRTLAEQSGGAMFSGAEIDQLSDLLRRHQESLQVPPRREYLWDRGWIMTLLLAWAGAEWLFRRAAGLW
jgi:hypothetical protein